jgi:hypothetical protein
VIVMLDVTVAVIAGMRATVIIGCRWGQPTAAGRA